MASFEERLYVNFIGNLTFHFNQIVTTSGIKYHISVESMTGYVHLTMQQSNNEWEIVGAPLPPQWITDIEKLLSKTIADHLKDN